jgi:hypothetical protein
LPQYTPHSLQSILNRLEKRVRAQHYDPYEQRAHSDYLEQMTKNFGRHLDLKLQFGQTRKKINKT